VRHVMNITDVDDKTIRGATAKKVSLEEYTKPYIEAFFEDLDTLGIQKADAYPKATEFLPQMIEAIETLIEKGFAYQRDGGVYFSIAKAQSYGRLSHLDMSSLQVGASARVALDEYDKDHVSDFALWKAYDPKRDGEIYWDSPFGKGRPGWHLECSVMAMALLGQTIDLHMGGVDNIFPHHENEIAQSEALSGACFSRFWMHSEHLIVEGKKMSKSLGNFYTLRDLVEKGFSGREIRYMLLQSHYKTQLNFTFEELEAVRHSLQRVQGLIRRLQDIEGTQDIKCVQEPVSHALDEFAKALADDLNLSVALSAIFELVRSINGLCDEDCVGKEGARHVLDALLRMDGVLGIFCFERTESPIPEELLEALKKRNAARLSKDWETADRLRQYILDRGYAIEDTPQGARLYQSRTKN